MLYDMHAYEIDREHSDPVWDIWKEWVDGDAEYLYTIKAEEFAAYLHALKNSSIDLHLHTLDSLYVHSVYRGLVAVEDQPSCVSSS